MSYLNAWNHCRSVCLYGSALENKNLRVHRILSRKLLVDLAVGKVNIVAFLPPPTILQSPPSDLANFLQNLQVCCLQRSRADWEPKWFCAAPTAWNRALSWRRRLVHILSMFLCCRQRGGQCRSHDDRVNDHDHQHGYQGHAVGDQEGSQRGHGWQSLRSGM